MSLLHPFRSRSHQYHLLQTSSRFLPSNSLLTKTPLLQSLLETGGGGLTTGGGVFGTAADRASNGSPAGSWGRSASPRRAPSSSNVNIWAAGEGWDHQTPSQVPQSTPGLGGWDQAPPSQVPQSTPGLVGGWDHAPSLAQLVPQHAAHSTNPFGTSPSNPTYHAPGDHSYVMLKTPFSKKVGTLDFDLIYDSYV